MAYFIGRQEFSSEDWELHERCESYMDARIKLKEYKRLDYVSRLSGIRPWCILDIYGGKILVIK